MERYDEFEQYLRATEPGQKERAELWQTAIGLQKVDGLEVSDYLVETAKKHIDGVVNIDEVDRLIRAYYQSGESREIPADVKEADEVSKNIVRVLSEPAFSFSVQGLAGLHRRIFTGAMKHAGEFRKYNITKKEWVLDGATVLYGPCEDLARTIEYDLEQERQFRYKGLSQIQIIEHLARFVSGIWQIHPFPEGNTRTTAVFTIKYLRSMGYTVENDMFKSHSWYFRNALVRANYRNAVKGVEPTHEYLVLFFRNLLLGENNELKNRYLHIRAAEVLGRSSQETTVGSQESSQENNVSSQEKPELVLTMLEGNPQINLQQIADKLGMTRRGVQKITDKLKAEGKLLREGSTKAGKWIVKR